MKRSILFIAVIVCNLVPTAAEYRLDSVRENACGEQYTHAFEYFPEQNTIIDNVNHYNWQNSAWELEQKMVVVRDDYSINLTQYLFVDNQWEQNGWPYIYRYDDNGNVIEQSSNGQRETREYDTNNNLLKSSNYTINGDEWKLWSYTENEYQNQLLVHTSSFQRSYTNDEMYLQKSWTYTYNEQNQVTEIYIEDHSFGGVDSKIIISYDNNREIRITYSLTEDEQHNPIWIEDTKSEHIIDAHNSILNQFSWDNITSTWVLNDKSEEMYNTNNQILSHFYCSYSDQVTNGYKREYAYDTNGNLIDYKQNNFNDTEWSFMSHVRYTYDYTISAADVMGLKIYIEYIQNGGVKNSFNMVNPILEENSLDENSNSSVTYSYFYSDEKNNAIENLSIFDHISKVIRNGQIFILRGNRTYTLTGAEVK